MIAKIYPAVMPAYLLLCLLLGGSAQGVWGNALLQLLAILILAWAALTRAPAGLPSAGRGLVVLAALLFLLFLIQLVPLPPAVWAALPGRSLVTDGYRLLGIPPPWLPSSLAPYETLSMALSLLPPLAVIIGLLRLGAFRESWLAGALLIGAVASVLIGLLQVTSGTQSWYFYRISNFGVATGTFANSNHLGALLLVSLPFLAALAGGRWLRARGTNARAVTLAVAMGGAAVLAMGIVVNESLAVMLLGIPVTMASGIMLMRLSPNRLRRGLALVTAALVLGAIAVGVLLKDRTSAGDPNSIAARVQIWETTMEAVGDHWLTGAGIGTFDQVYPRYEEPATIGRTFANHAHNDYLEIAVEAGVPGLLLLGAFLIWWGQAAVKAWTSREPSLYAKAATIASGALLLHSLVDFPLRTAALAAVMATCLSLMAGARGQREDAHPGEQRPTRHVTL